MKKKLLAGFATGLFMVGIVGVASATPITQSDMSSSAFVEDFEGLHGAPGMISWDPFYPGWVVPTAPYDFGNGMVMTLPDPNIFDGVIVGDWSVDDASFYLVGNGIISSALDLTSGTAYWGMNDDSLTLELTFALGIDQFGFAFNNAGKPINTTIIDAYDMDGEWIERVVGNGANTGSISEWLGLETATTIGSVLISGHYTVIDDITFSTTAPVPEPTTMLLFGTGIAGLAGSKLRRKKK